MSLDLHSLRVDRAVARSNSTDAGRGVGHDDRVDRGGLQPVADVSTGGWIAGRLGTFGGGVGSVVPRGFEAYARVLHPVPDADWSNVRWAEVCASTGRRAHALMQWDAIAGVAETSTGTGTATTRTMLWPGAPPQAGNLDSATLVTLCQVLARHTRPAGRSTPKTPSPTTGTPSTPDRRSAGSALTSGIPLTAPGGVPVPQPLLGRLRRLTPHTWTRGQYPFTTMPAPGRAGHR